MPNVIAHMRITDEVYPDAPVDYMLGSVLPDFIRMARDYDNSTVRPADFHGTAFEDGIKFHSRTDAVFDSLPADKQLCLSALGDLDRLYSVKRGAARACADIGTEILLDGVLLEQLKISKFYDSIRQRILKSREQIEAIGSKLPKGMIERYFSKDWSGVYADPEAVAKMLHRRFAATRLGYLAFTEEHIPEVVTALKIQKARLQQVGGELLRQTVHTLRSESHQANLS